MQTIDWDFEVFFDGDCPICVKEIGMLRRFDRKKRILFTDIAAAGFEPKSIGMDIETLMGSIRGRDRNGTWYAGLEVFRKLYEAIGLKPLVVLTRLPGISHGLELGYRWFAKNRLKLTGRCTTETCNVTMEK